MASSRRRESLSADERLALKKRILRRFRNIVRLAYHNRYWLGEIEDFQLTDNVRRNIMLLTKKKKILSSLTIKEKSILCKPTKTRTEEEKLYLNKTIGGLKCFRRYPPNVKSALASVTYFLYFPPDRMITRQNHEPYGMYFLLSGECSVTVAHYDKFLKEWIPEDTGILGPGTTFGDVSLLHNIKRLATITTTTHCELLLIKKDDFHSIIKETVLKVWTEIQATLDRFTYFKNWDEMTKLEASIVTKTRSYNPDETILGDNVGQPTYVHFIIKGTCSMIEHMKIRSCSDSGTPRYFQTPIKEKDDDLDSTITQILRRYRHYLEPIDEENVSVNSISKDGRSSRGTKAKVSIKQNFSLVSDYSKTSKASRASKVSKTSKVSKASKKSKASVSNAPARPRVSSLRVSNISTAYMLTKEFHEQGMHIKCSQNIHFFKVCEMLEGACFNIGERLDRRRIVAVTPVTCLMLPRYWVLRNNNDGIWNRVRQFLEQHIPDSKQIFKLFVQQRKFDKYKKQLIRNILEEKKIGTNNSIHNVPYSIRLRDGTDTKYLPDY